MPETSKTIRVRRRSSPQEDFAPTPEKPVVAPILESSPKKNHVDNLTVLDLFAMMALSGLSRKLDDPHLMAKESYRVANEMYKIFEGNLE